MSRCFDYSTVPSVSVVKSNLSSLLLYSCKEEAGETYREFPLLFPDWWGRGQYNHLSTLYPFIVIAAQHNRVKQLPVKKNHRLDPNEVCVSLTANWSFAAGAVSGGEGGQPDLLYWWATVTFHCNNPYSLADWSHSLLLICQWMAMNKCDRANYMFLWVTLCFSLCKLFWMKQRGSICLSVTQKSSVGSG